MSEAFGPWLRRLRAFFEGRGKPLPSLISHEKAYRLAERNIGTYEVPGPEDNPKIVGWFSKVGHSWVQDDETAWCAAFLGAMLEEVGIPSTRALNARSYLNWGGSVPFSAARKGDVAVFWRGDPGGWQGHVGFFVQMHGTDEIIVLGGNQRNRVNRMAYPRNQLLSIRRYTGVST